MRRYRHLTYSVVVALLLGVSTFPAHARADIITPFVQRGCHVPQGDLICDPNGPPKGTMLYFNGQPFRFTGINIYNANSNGWCNYSYDDATLDSSLNAISPAGGVFRAWFFQQLATTNGIRDWTAFDRTLAAARRHGFRVIATLIDQWGDCGTTGPHGYGYKTDQWYRGGYLQADPLGTTSYIGWVNQVAARYKDDTAILAWQLVNEAEVKTAPNGTCPSDAAQVLKAFAAQSSAVVKGADPNHLVSLGTIGTGQCGAQGPEYSDVHNLDTIDLCEYHDYSPQDAMPGDVYNGLQVRINQCNALDKPLFVGESGIKPTEVGGTPGARAKASQAKFEKQFEAGVVGEVLWNWDRNGSLADNYNIGPGDPSLGVLRGTTSFVELDTFAFSRDGTRMALTGDMNGVHALYLANGDGSNATLLVADGYAQQPSFTPDGQKLVYFGRWPSYQDPGVFIVPIDLSSPPRRISDAAVTDEEEPSVSADGTKVVVVAPDPSSGTLSAIRVIDISGPSPVDSQVFDGYPNLAPQNPAFSADGATILFGATGFAGPAYTQVASIPVTGGSATQLTHFTGDGDAAALPHASFGGANVGKVMFIHINSLANPIDFYTMNPDGSGQTVVSNVVPPGSTRFYGGGGAIWTANGQIAHVFRWYDDRTTKIFPSFGIPQPPTQPRSAPVAAAGDGVASVSWSKPSYDGGLPVTSYTVTASPGSVRATVGGATTTATVSGLTNGTAYTFTVTAINGEGTSVPSLPSSAVTPQAGATPPASVQQPVSGGSTATTDPGTGPTPSQPVTAALAMPANSPSGIASITQSSITEPAPSGFSLVGQQVQISAPPGTPASPLTLTFSLDASATAGEPAGSLQIYRTEGTGTPVAVPDCAGAAGVASPDPCVAGRQSLPGGDIQLTVLTSSASIWNLALDTIPPSITFGTPADGALYKLRQVVNASYTCSDLGSGIASCTAPVASGAAVDTATIGTKSFTVTARDKAGNVRTITHAYAVRFDFAGFFNPISNPPTLNAVKAGSVVIESFTLAGNQGMGIIAAGYPKIQAASCTTLATSGPASPIAGTLHYGSAAFGTRYYEQWTSQKSWAATCQAVTIRLSDGTDHVAFFKFK